MGDALSRSWWLLAACRGRSDLPWYPERGDDVTEALAVCERCSVRQPCLADADAFETDRSYGIRGGLTARNRARRRSLTLRRRI